MSNHLSTQAFAFSYGTMIRQSLSDGRTIGNITSYSKTTTKHQNREDVRHCSIVLDDVPIGCQDLSAVAHERRLLTIKRALAP
mgnify:CR=1 FL=1